jgi:5-methylcytosine-specific restriction endonuclease McrA
MRKYTKSLLQDAVTNSASYAGVLRHLGLVQAGGTQSHIARMIKKFEIDTNHFTGQAHNKGTRDPKRKTWQQILVLGSPTNLRTKTVQLKRALLEYGLTEQCLECKLGPSWNDKPLTLQVDHVNGIIYDNRPENLRLLCPNCHSQTDTFCKVKRIT